MPTLHVSPLLSVSVLKPVSETVCKRRTEKKKLAGDHMDTSKVPGGDPYVFGVWFTYLIQEYLWGYPEQLVLTAEEPLVIARP